MIRIMTWLAVVAAITLGLVGATPTGAVTDVPTVVVSPAVAHAGETVTISGAGCPQPGWTNTNWNVKVVVAGIENNPIMAGQITEPDDSGTKTGTGFTLELRTPGDSTIMAVTGDSWEWVIEVPGDWPPGAYSVNATCIGEFFEDGSVNFVGSELLVEAAPTATTTTSTTTPHPPSPPAAPVPESPAFTG